MTVFRAPKRLYSISALCFFSFILWVIYQANTGKESVFFQLVASIPYGDKLGHFCLFGILTLLSNLALNFTLITCLTVKFYLGSLLVFIFVTLEEFSQFFIANRTADFSDLFADIFGIIVFSYITFYLQQKASR